jgi:alpha-glucoside transport system substrate-binding protein
MGVREGDGGSTPRQCRGRARRRRPAAWAGAILLAVATWACSTPSGTQIGGAVSVLGSWEGPEQDAFMAMVAPFEQRTGIHIEYSSTRDLQGVVQRGIAAGDPPDVAGLPGPGFMQQFARSGGLKDLTDVIDVASYKAETIPAFIDLGTIDGKLVGVFIKATVKGLLWYDPTAWTMGAPQSWSDLLHVARMTTTADTKPWCVGLDSGASSGWPGTDWIEDFLLRQSGPGAYDRWVAGQLAWTSPEVRAAFVSFGQVVADGAVYGGTSGALTTHFSLAGAPLFDRPPGCYFLHQGSFMASFLADDPRHPGASFDFFPFPDIDPRWSGSLIGGGDLLGLVRDRPQARELIRYLVTPEAQTIWVKQGGALSSNLRVDAYPDERTAREAKLLASANHLRFDASDAMPDELNAAFWQAVLDFTKYPDRLDTILAHLDSVAAKSYGN